MDYEIRTYEVSKRIGRESRGEVESRGRGTGAGQDGKEEEEKMEESRRVLPVDSAW